MDTLTQSVLSEIRNHEGIAFMEIVKRFNLVSGIDHIITNLLKGGLIKVKRQGYFVK